MSAASGRADGQGSCLWTGGAYPGQEGVIVEADEIGITIKAWYEGSPWLALEPQLTWAELDALRESGRAALESEVAELAQEVLDAFAAEDAPYFGETGDLERDAKNLAAGVLALQRERDRLETANQIHYEAWKARVEDVERLRQAREATELLLEARAQRIDALQSRVDEMAEALREVLGWPLPEGMVETYSLPGWLATRARAALGETP